jgi:hypothetical protein
LNDEKVLVTIVFQPLRFPAVSTVAIVPAKRARNEKIISDIRISSR